MREEKIGNERFWEDLKTVVRDGQELLKAGATTVKQRVVSTAQATGHLVEEKPYVALGVAFGVGLLAGLLLSGVWSGRRGSDED